MAKKSYKGLKTLRLTEAQLSALKTMAEKDATLKALLPQHKARFGNGLRRRRGSPVPPPPARQRRRTSRPAFARSTRPLPG